MKVYVLPPLVTVGRLCATPGISLVPASPEACAYVTSPV